MRAVLIGMAILLSSLHSMADERSGKPTEPGWCARHAGDHVLLLGESFAFQLAAPRGWHINGEPEVPGRPDILATLERDHPPAAPSCFIHFSQQHRARGETARMVVDRDTARFRERGAGGDIAQTLAKIECGKRETLRVDISQPGAPLYEGVVFIEERNAFVIATMQCKTSKAVQQMAPVFESVLASYHFLTDNVKMAEDKRARRRR
jgi:hypothetical protein